jgi:DNA-directed RNA polymerase subunit RPC12/RpoP
MPPSQGELRRQAVETLDRLITRQKNDPNWEKWPDGTSSDARKAVYKEILEGFATIAEAKEYVEELPEDNVIFTSRGDEIPFLLIKLIVADIEKNSWLSPFRKSKPGKSQQPTLLPLIIRCAWCGKYLGEKEPYEDMSETHSICPECRAKYFPKKDSSSPLTVRSIPRDELKRIAGKYGWWAARQAEALCPHNDVVCVEREAKRLLEVVKHRTGGGTW